MTSRISGKNKEKKAKRKNSVKKSKQETKKRYKETENRVAWLVQPGYLHVQATPLPLHHSETDDLKN